MKICIVMCWGFEKLDGSNLRVYFLLKELINRKHDITVLHSSKEQVEYTKKHFGCNATDIGQTINRWVSVKEKMKNYITFVRAARKKIKQIDCDVIFGISLINSLAAISKKGAKKRIMYVDFMSNYFQYGHKKGIKNKILYQLGNAMEDYTIKKADKILMITNALKCLVKKKHHSKIVIVSDGADTDKFKPGLDPGIIKKEYNLEGKVVIGYQGGIEPHDGLQFLAMASPLILKQIPDVVFLVAGRGAYLDKVKEIVKENGTEKNWIFTGWVDFEKIPYFMAATDLNVVPIPNHPATQGVITFRLLESMAAGVNVIASDLPGIREIADETMINFTHPNDTPRFAEDIIKALKMEKEELNTQKINARKKLEGLDWREIAKRDADFVEGKLDTN